MALSEEFKTDITLGKAREDCTFKGNKYRITVLSDVLLRFEYSETGKFNDYPTIFAINRNFAKKPVFTVKQDEKYINITNDYFILEYSKEKPYIASKLVPDSNLRITLKGTDKLWYFGNPEVKNLKGTTYSFDNKTNISLSKGLYNLDGFASIDDTMSPVFISDGTIKKNPSDALDVYVFIYKNDFQKALDSYFELTGKPSFIPRYALGVCWNKNEDYTEEELKDIISNFNKINIPLSSILLGSKWNLNKEGKTLSNYKFDNEKYKNLEQTINDIHQKNVFLGLTINPQSGITPYDSGYQSLKTKLNITKDGIIPINVYNTAILETFLNETLANLNIDFIKIDEITEDKTKTFMLMHYIYKSLSKTAERRGLILSRNPGIASHRYPALYSGNTKVSWKTLKYLPYFNITSSNLGLSYYSHDIGGYEGGVEDSELYTRYVQFGTYSPIFRFSSKEGRYYKREPWKWDIFTESIVKDYIRIRHRLIPYIYSEMYKYSKDGINLIKPLYLDYEKILDEPLYKNEYHFGKELFVCPITEPKDKVMNRVVHRMYLPEGTWYDFKTGKKFPGGKRYVTFYKDEDYPVYAKSGAIVPMAILDENNLNSVKPPEKMEIQVFPGVSNNYDLYEDDGVTNLYKEGYYIVTNIDYNYRKNNYTLILRPTQGKTGIIPDKRDYKIKFRNTKRPEYVKVNVGRFEVEFTTRSDENDFIIEVPNVPTNQQLTINCGGEAIEIDAVRLINEDIDEIISGLLIETTLKEKIASIIFSDMTIRKKRIAIRKLKHSGLNKLFIKMFIKLLEYISEI